VRDPDSASEEPTRGDGPVPEGPADRSDVGAYYTGGDVADFLARRGLWEALRTELEADLEHGRTPDGLEPEHLSRAVHDRGSHGADRRTVTGFDVLSRRCADEPAVREYLDAELRDLTVCDPAAGDGSLLLAVAQTLFAWRSRCVDRDGYALRREILSRNLFGVDVREDAVKTCRRRLRDWALDASGGSAAGDGRDGGVGPSPNVQVGNSLLGFVDTAPLVEGRASTPEAGNPRARLDERYAARQRGIEDGPRMTHHVDSADAAVRSLGTAVDPSPTLRVNVPDGLPDALSAYLEREGFRTYTYTARLDVPAPGSTDPGDRRPGEEDLEELFGRLRSVWKDWEVVVERGYVGADFAPGRLEACHWPLDFPAFREAGGFDLVVGNPPYGASVSPEAEPLLTSEANYGCQGASDSCEWFYERALDLAAPDGVVSYVVTKAVAFYASWADIRERLLAETDLRHVFDVGLGFADVDLETVALVSVLDPGRDGGGPEAGTDRGGDDHAGGGAGGVRAGTGRAAVYRSEDRRRTDANRPVHAGWVDQRVMCNAGTVVFAPVTDDERAVLDRVRARERRLENAMSTRETTRQLYVPDSEKRTLAAGTDAYIESNPWVRPFHLTDVWHCDLSAYRDAVGGYAVPRVMLKVLRGSRLRAWLDPRGELVGTEKLVNVPLEEHDPDGIAFVYAALNHPCASFYLQKAVFSGTTETARVLDGHYSGSIPLPAPSPVVETAAAHLARTLTLGRQLAHDTDRDPGPACDRVHDALEALVGECYLDGQTERVRAWSDALLADGPAADRVRALFGSFYTDRYATPDGDPERHWADIASVLGDTAAAVAGWDTGRVCESSEMSVVRDALG